MTTASDDITDTQKVLFELNHALNSLVALRSTVSGYPTEYRQRAIIDLDAAYSHIDKAHDHMEQMCQKS
jgi:hypothetical protein